MRVNTVARNLQDPMKRSNTKEFIQVNSQMNKISNDFFILLHTFQVRNHMNVKFVENASEYLIA